MSLPERSTIATTSTIAPTTIPTATTTVPFPTTIPTAPTVPGPYPMTIDGVVIAERPGRIAALSATHVEMLFAIGAGDRIIAVDAFTNYPPEAADIDAVDAFNLNVEAVIALDPDLVILAFDPGGAVDALRQVALPTFLLGPANDLDEVYRQITLLGTVTGEEDAAASLVAEMRTEIVAAVAATEVHGRGATYYHETDPFSYYTPNSDTFIGRIYGLFGMVNIADAAGDEFGSGYPQLSPEFIIDSDPDWVFLTFGETARSVAQRPGWDTMTALQEERVFELDYDIASRWGPRVVDLVQAIAGALAEG